MHYSKPSLESRVLGCWRGKTAGGALGLPIEGRTEHQSLSFYDPVPTVVPPNDDLELQLVWPELMEKHSGPLMIEDVADAWQKHIHYVPATHRMPWECQNSFTASAATHEVRLELNSANPSQDASLILVDASLHFAPWNGVELPRRASLPPSL